MTSGSIYASLALVGITVFGLVAYILVGLRRRKKNPNAYRWQPEQDYDVVLRGETPMTPGFPTLVKREDVKENKRSKDLSA